MKERYVTESGDIVRKYVIFLDQESIKKIRFISFPEEEMMKSHVKNYNPAGNLIMFLDHVIISDLPSVEKLRLLMSELPIGKTLDIILPIQFHRSVNKFGQVISAYTVDLERYSTLADGKTPVMPAYLSGDVVEPDFKQYVKTNSYPETLANKKIKTPVIGDDLYLSGFVGWIDQNDKPRREKIVIR